jgi:ABC-type Fe3+/spermidine/putrescine transport system ATPase subunit
VPTSSEPLLEVRGLSAAWNGRPVLTDVSLEVHDGEFVVLMGPNGSGKTTLLRCLAGFEPPTRGEIRLAGRSIVHLPTHRRGIGMLFQEPALFPRRNVWENIAYGLEVARRPPEEVARRVGELLRLLHLEGLEARESSELSGGERQRVALARTLAPGPSLVLLDEPFASIDAGIRAEMRAEFRRVLARLGVAAIHVTHDREEGLFLGDRVVLLYEGRLLQVGTPHEVFQRPASVDAARFLGYNIVSEGGRPVAVHPRDVVVRPGGEGPNAEVEACGIVGDEHALVLKLPNGERIEARTRGELSPPPVGSRVSLAWARSIPLPG